MIVEMLFNGIHVPIIVIIIVFHIDVVVKLISIELSFLRLHQSKWWDIVDRISTK